MIADPYIISVPQLLCDYILAFGALGLAGFFHNSKAGMLKGYFAGILGRYFFSVLSGVVFFADYAPEGSSALGYSLTYNASYIGAEAILTVVVLCIPSVRAALNRIKTEALEKGVKKDNKKAQSAEA